MLYSDRGIPDGDAVQNSTSRAATHSCSHAVHFYEDEALFLDSLCEYVGGALGAGGACVVAATQAHCAAIEDRLRGFGVDLPYLAALGRYIAIDAEGTLSLFMRGGMPDPILFRQSLEPIFLQARASLRRGTLPVVAFGEMVALLCEENRYEAAFQLEQIWNGFAREMNIVLRCAYPMALFAEPGKETWYQRVCSEHSGVIPSESFTRLNHAEEQWRMVSSLQQQASTLQTALEQQRRAEQERKKVEDRLRRSEEFARNIVESSVDCVKVLDLDGRIEFMNAPGLLAIEADSITQVLGQNWVDFWDEEDRPRAAAAIAEAASGSVGSFQGESRTFAGTPKSWDVKITPSRGADGRVEQLIAMSRDITELRIAQMAAIHAEKLATAGRMAATIAHEINNPLEAVTNFIYLAQSSDNLPDDARQHLEVADRELTRVAHIARQTLGFYRSTSTERLIPVPDLVRDALMIYERRMRNKEIAVEISVPEDLQLFGKDGELRQALLNLTANAIDACPTGGKIWFRAQKARNWSTGDEGVRITVADNGSGMSAETQRRIFAPFFTTKADVGTGIGLWVTKCLIEQRGGFMRFRSSQGKTCGTAMSFFVPFSRPEIIHQAV
jgi:PAS domain S-box-containing protein